jgi:hypothetical protein
MKHYELLRQCAAMLQFHQADGEAHTRDIHLTLSWPDGFGRFPFLGGSTELLSINANAGVRNYSVSIKRIITAIGKAL